MQQERTLALFKPDAVGHPWLFRSKEVVEDDEGNSVEKTIVKQVAADKSAKMRDRLLSEGFEIVRERRTVLSREKAKEFYSEHRGKPFFDELVSYMSSGPVIALELVRDNAIASWRDLMGPTNSIIAREEEESKLAAQKSKTIRRPSVSSQSDENADAEEEEEDGASVESTEWEVMENWCLRAAFGKDATRNACHGSDSSFSAQREIEFFFPSEKQWERTVLVIKPDVVANGQVDAIIDALETNGLMVCASGTSTLSVTDFNALFGDVLKDSPDLEEHMELGTQGPSTALIIEGFNAIRRTVLLVGPDTCDRGLAKYFGTDKVKNGFAVCTSGGQVSALQTYFFPGALEIEKTFALIKPDVNNGGTHKKILQEIEACGFTVTASKRLVLNKHQASVLSATYNAKQQAEMLSNLCDGPSIALTLAKPGAVRCLRVLAGPCNPALALKVAPWSLRARYGTNDVKNAIHVAETLDDANAEITVVLKNVITDASISTADILVQPQANKQTLQHVLVAGLAHISKHKPKKLDAIRGLGEWLLANNPNTNKTDLNKAMENDFSFGSFESSLTCSKSANSELSALGDGAYEKTNNVFNPKLANGGAPVPIPALLSSTRVIFALGPVGCGKKTQCKLITDEYGFHHILPYELLRAEAESKSALGLEIAQVMANGEVVPAALVIAQIHKAMRRSGNHRFLIDDFPRDLEQAFLFEKQICPCESVIHFEIPSSVAEERALKALQVSSDPGKQIMTPDEQEAMVKTQIASFEERSMPVVNFYRKVGKVKCLDASPASAQRVFDGVRAFIEPKVVFVFGGPGSGKTQLCKRVEKEFGYVHICAGELLRTVASKGTEAGQRLKRMIVQGQLVPTAEMLALLRTAMEESPGDKFILDGFPRSLKQFHEFEKHVTSAAFAIYLGLPKAIMRARTGMSGGFKKRMSLFWDEDIKVIEAMTKLGRVRRFDAGGTPEQVWNAVQSCFNPQVVIALGAPGSGMEEHCAALASKFGYVVLDAQQLLEAEVARESREGLVIDQMVRNGQIVPVELKLMVFKKTMQGAGTNKFIIHGFFRALDQYVAWSERGMYRVTHAIYFDCPEPLCVERAVMANISEVESKIHTFTTQTLPVVNKFARSGQLKTVNAAEDFETVQEELGVIFSPEEYVVVVGKGNLEPSVLKSELKTFAESQGYQLINVPEMMETAIEHCGGMDGELARQNKPDAVHKLLRVALQSSGRKGLILTMYPDTRTQVSELSTVMGLPRFVFHLRCPSSIIRQTAIDSGKEESEADSLANQHEVLSMRVEKPTVERFAEVGAQIVEIQTSTLHLASNGGVKLCDKLLEPFEPELVILIGSTGAGRGELATQLARHHGFYHINTSSLFQEEIGRGSANGRRIKQALDAKQSIPLNIAIEVIKNEVIHHQTERILLDGFPRLVGDGFPFVHDQFRALEQSIGRIKGVINLIVPEEVRAERVPKTITADELELANETFQIQKVPVLQYARTLKNLVFDVDSSPSPDIVADSVVNVLAQREADEAAEYRLLTMTVQDIVNGKIADVIALYGADESHVQDVEDYFVQFDMNGDGQLTFGEMISKVQAWGIAKDPKEYMGMDFQDESVVTKDEWYRFIFKAVFLLDKVGDVKDEESKEEEEEEEEEE